MNRIRLFFAFAIVLGIIEALYFYPLLPDRMAVHFNASGRADGWGPKGPFFLTMGTVFTIMTALFSGLPSLIRLVPVSLINLPNKDYWLAPERKEETMRRITNQFFFIGAMALLLLDGVFYFTLKTNLSGTPVLPTKWMWGMIIGFFIVNIVWTISMIRSFRRPAR